MRMVTLIRDGIHSSAGLESGHLVDDPGSGVRSHGGVPTVRGNGEHMGGPIERAHHHPATVRRKSNILHLER